MFWNFDTNNLKKINIGQILIQTVVVGVVALMLVFLFGNYLNNITTKNINIGFDFLDDSAGFSIGQTLIDYDTSDSYFKVYIVGLLNTLLASFIAIIFATVIGFVFGIFLLVDNWLLVKIAETYVEIIRNIPPLLHVLFWYVVVILKILPNYNESINIGNILYINVRGATIPALDWNNKALLFFILFVPLIVLSIYIARHSKRLRLEGKKAVSKLWQVGIWVAIVVLLVITKPFVIVMPVQGKFVFTSGFTFYPELFALVVALSTYTSTYIATIVRSSIMSIPKVQIEAAHSLGLSFFQRLRYVVIPLAVRSMVPPLTNQYLNIIKNSSLGVAIGYPEIIAVFAGTSLNQSGRVIEIMTMVMLTYFAISIFTSWLMNIYNSRVNK